MLETKKCDYCHNLSNRLILITYDKLKFNVCGKCATLFLKKYSKIVNNKK